MQKICPTCGEGIVLERGECGMCLSYGDTEVEDARAVTEDFIEFLNSMGVEPTCGDCGQISKCGEDYDTEACDSFESPAPTEGQGRVRVKHWVSDFPWSQCKKCEAPCDGVMDHCLDSYEEDWTNVWVEIGGIKLYPYWVISKNNEQLRAALSILDERGRVIVKTKDLSNGLNALVLARERDMVRLSAMTKAFNVTRCYRGHNIKGIQLHETPKNLWWVIDWDSKQELEMIELEQL